MPGYNLLNIERAAGIAAGKVEAAKADGDYEGNEATWDDYVVGLVGPMADNAARWTVENAELAKSERRKAQAAVKTIEALLKVKGFEDKHFDAMQQQAQIVLQSISDIKDDNNELNDALVPEYRKDGWITTARGAMQDPSRINNMQKARLIQIKVGAGTIQLTKRLEEYEKRVNAYIKAGQRKLGDLSSLNDAMDDVDRIVAEMDSERQEVSDILYKCSNPLSTIEQNKKAKTALDPRVMDMISGYSATFKANGKQARGKLKSMTISINMLSKRLKGTVGLADMCKPQIKDATEFLKIAKAEYSDFESRVKDAEKIIKKLQKLG